MAYTAEVSRANPSCFLFLIDQSGSMEDPFAGAGGDGNSARSKAEGVSDAINRLLQNLVIKCAKPEGIRDYYHIGVIGYGGQAIASHVAPAFSGPLAGKELVPISEVANSPARIEERGKRMDDGAGGLVEQQVKFPVWFDPIANGGTPMSQALTNVENILKNWLTEHPRSFPPIVINITDGESTDGDPTPAADSLKALATSDGNVLLFNLHLSSQKGKPIEFPDAEGGLADDWAKMLFRMSSPLPEYMSKIAQEEGYKTSPKTRGFAFNADLVSVIRFLDIGTRPSNLR